MFICTPRKHAIAALLLCLARAVMIHENKTYSKKLLEMDRLGKDDQVIVKKSGTDEMAGQYFCFNSKCTINVCEFCFKVESGYLVLHNLSPLFRYDAFLNGVKIPVLLNFTLDEEDVSSSSTTAAVTDDPLISSATPTEDDSSSSTTPPVPDVPFISSITPTESRHTTKEEALSTEAKVAIGIGAPLALIALVVVIAITIDVVTARKAGRDARIFRFIKRLRRDPEPNLPVENPDRVYLEAVEMSSLMNSDAALHLEVVTEEFTED